MITGLHRGAEMNDPVLKPKRGEVWFTFDFRPRDANVFEMIGKVFVRLTAVASLSSHSSRSAAVVVIFMLRIIDAITSLFAAAAAVVVAAAAVVVAVVVVVQNMIHMTSTTSTAVVVIGAISTLPDAAFVACNSFFASPSDSKY